MIHSLHETHCIQFNVTLYLAQSQSIYLSIPTSALIIPIYQTNIHKTIHHLCSHQTNLKTHVHRCHHCIPRILQRRCITPSLMRIAKQTLKMCDETQCLPLTCLRADSSPGHNECTQTSTRNSSSVFKCCMRMGTERRAESLHDCTSGNWITADVTAGVQTAKTDHRRALQQVIRVLIIFSWLIRQRFSLPIYTTSRHKAAAQ